MSYNEKSDLTAHGYGPQVTREVMAGGGPHPGPMPPNPYDPNDPVFQNMVDEAIRAEGRRFVEWTKTANYPVFVARALAEADEAAVNAPQHGTGPVWATIEVTDRSKLLIRELLDQGLAVFDDAKVNIQINLENRYRGSARSVRSAATSAFALALSKPGFEFYLWSLPVPETGATD